MNSRFLLSPDGGDFNWPILASTTSASCKADLGQTKKLFASRLADWPEEGH